MNDFFPKQMVGTIFCFSPNKGPITGPLLLKYLIYYRMYLTVTISFLYITHIWAGTQLHVASLATVTEATWE